MSTLRHPARVPTREVSLGKGVFFLLAAMLIFGVQDAASKILVQDYSPFQIVMLR